MEEEKGKIYDITGLAFLAIFALFSLYYFQTITGNAAGYKSQLYVQGMPLVLISLLFFSGWFLVVKRKWKIKN